MPDTLKIRFAGQESKRSVATVMPGRIFHDLRHTANTRIMLAGVMQGVRSELIGHTSRHSRDVNDRYTQVALPEKRDAIRKFEAWLSAEAETCPTGNSSRGNAGAITAALSPGRDQDNRQEATIRSPDEAVTDAPSRKAWVSNMPVDVILEQIGNRKSAWQPFRKNSTPRRFF